MRPLVLTLAGAAIGLAAVLPLARPLAVPADTGVQVAPDATSTAAARPVAAPTKRITVTGPLIATRYGPVQVRIVLAGPRLVSAQAVQLPNAEGESRRISRHAGPELARQAVATQGMVDGVSGATWTSEGYRRSLQAALDVGRAAATTPTTS